MPGGEGGIERDREFPIKKIWVGDSGKGVFFLIPNLPQLVAGNTKVFEGLSIYHTSSLKTEGIYR
jgi:hypothetical protein